jgi:hypothetical protein
MTGKEDTITFERRLYAELAAILAMDLTMTKSKERLPNFEWQSIPRDPARGKKGFIVGHGLASEFEVGLPNLHLLGVFDPVHEDGSPNHDKGQSYYWKLTMDVGDVARHVLELPSVEALPLESLLESFIAMGNLHGNVSTSRRPHTPDPEYRQAFEFLAEAGYVERIAGQFKWTDKAYEPMRKNYLWTVEGESWADIDDDHVELVWQKMPDDIKQAYFLSGKIDRIGFSIIYDTRWRNGAWQEPEPRGSRVLPTGRSVGIAHDLYRRYLKGDWPK